MQSFDKQTYLGGNLPILRGTKTSDLRNNGLNIVLPMGQQILMVSDDGPQQLQIDHLVQI
jgi:hypothetical protein